MPNTATARNTTPATEPGPAARAHHKIRSLAVTGGFLDGAVLEFADGLNCIIGGRGAASSC